MRRNEIICQILIDNGLAKSYPEALSKFVQTFVEDFREKSLDHWDTNVPTELAQKFLNSVAKKESTDIKSLIIELENFLKKSKLSLILMLGWHLFLQSCHR